MPVYRFAVSLSLACPRCIAGSKAGYNIKNKKPDVLHQAFLMGEYHSSPLLPLSPTK